MGGRAAMWSILAIRFCSEVSFGFFAGGVVVSSILPA